ncbi:DpnI domain-containing protein [Helicobacter sp. 13S00477-4]|uniref:DpnI domain-containing protein n=1 Tax=Helicobacter sp. 13S00477-4 TaxID=1905759 RepID=UPI000BA64C71|nr:DpnI domain-containing protein [Helicobacter sp. 13S00477-4]PAF52315.1 restriction endonuclease [Helicobacter sp. 13S00477-4]
MELKFDISLVKDYKAKSQKIRVMSEAWIRENGYCVKCGLELNSFKNNKPVGDFYCSHCDEEFELKSKNGKLNETIIDGAYATMIEKIDNFKVPNFFYLNYDEDLIIQNLIVIPKYYFTRDIIEKRKPLSDSARRQGWVGCNINLKLIPKIGRLFLIKNKNVISKNEVLDSFHKMLFLRNQEQLSKGWLLDIMLCIERLNKAEFCLSDLYKFQDFLKIRHPDNGNIKAKIRQQLQILRDNQYLRFINRGQYKIL